MSMYNNLMNGVNPCTFSVLPMLGNHPNHYPRFRDCFVDDGKIVVLTRTGSRSEYVEENKAMTESEFYLSDENLEKDGTYVLWYFSVPDKWKGDFGLILSGNGTKVSDEYVQNCKDVYPKIADKFGRVFR